MSTVTEKENPSVHVRAGFSCGQRLQIICLFAFPEFLTSDTFFFSLLSSRLYLDFTGFPTNAPLLFQGVTNAVTFGHVIPSP